MNILVISYTFHPNKDGVAVATAALCLGLIDQGWNVTVLTSAVNPKRNSFLWNGIQIQEFQENCNGRNQIEIHINGLDFIDYLKSGSWDVIIFETYYLLLPKALPFLNQLSAPKILVSHGYGDTQWSFNKRFPFGLKRLALGIMKTFVMPLWLRKFDRVVYLSEHTDLTGFCDHFVAKMTRFSRRCIIPNGIDPTILSSDPDGFRIRNSISPEAHLFVCVANYSLRKNQGFAARAFRKASIPNSALVFIGSEFNETSYRFQQEDAPNLKHDNKQTIIWLENQSREETLNAIAASDVLLLSANLEAQPIVLLEAMREGVPWIARNTGCIPIMEGGICVKTVKQMADAMIRLAHDHELRKTLGEIGRVAVRKRYNLETYVQSYVKLINDLASSRSSKVTQPISSL